MGALGGLDEPRARGYRLCMTRSRKGDLSLFLRRYWGYLVLAIAVAGWQEHAFTLAVIGALCLLSLIYFLAAAPMWCQAENRKEGTRCRNNSHGMLGGCNQVRQHKWQRVRDFFIPARWRSTLRSLTASPATTLGTVGAIASLVPITGALLAHV